MPQRTHGLAALHGSIPPLVTPFRNGAVDYDKYAELVKRCHPDANGGDRSAETRLQRVIKAYKTLQKAKLA